MDLTATVFSSAWASGVNAWATIAVLSLLGRSGTVGVPEQLESNPVLFGAIVMFGIEFVTDKIPFVDNLWDGLMTVVRPIVGAVLGFMLSGDADVSRPEEAIAGAGAGLTSLSSHSIKAGLRLGINASPEPVSNILASLTEDSLAITVAYFAIENPELAAAIAFVLLVAGAALVIFLWRRIRAAWGKYRQWRQDRHRGPP